MGHTGHPTIRRYCLIGAVLVPSVAALLLLGITHRDRRPPEPVFSGRSVTAWLTSSDYATNRAAVSMAVLALGESALPALRRMLRSGNKPERIWFARAPRWLYHRLPIGASQFDRKDRAMWALQTLGQAGRKASPDLLALLRDPTEHWNQRTLAMSTFRQIGADPALLIPVLDKLTNDAAMRGIAVAELQHLRRNLATQQERKTQRALERSLGARRELTNEDFRPSTSLFTNVSLQLQ